MRPPVVGGAGLDGLQPDRKRAHLLRVPVWDRGAPHHRLV